MARGKITEYDPGAFSPSATGTPGLDESGQILARGAEALGRGVQALGQGVGRALIERQEASDNLTAMDKFGEFEFESTRKKFELQRVYQNDPEKYVVAAKEESAKLADNFSKGMSGGVAKKFKSLSTRSIAQDAEGNMRWAFARDNEIQTGKITSIKQDIVLKASMAASPQDLLAIKGDFAAVAPAAQKFISKEDDDKLTKTHWDTAKKMSMEAQIMNTPNQLKTALDGHAYDGILDPDEIKTYSDKARTAIDNRAYDDLYRTLNLAGGKTLDTLKGLDDGSINITTLIAERDAVWANRKKDMSPAAQAITQSYLDVHDALIAGQARSVQRTPLGAEEHKTALAEVTRKWDTYLGEKKAAKQRPSPSDITEQLDLVGDLVKARNKGVIRPNEFADKVSILTTKHALEKNDAFGAMPFNQAIDQAGAAPAWYRFGRDKDVVSAGYRQIIASVDSQYPELLPEERTIIKTQMLSQFHQVVKDTPPETLKGMTTDNQKMAFVRGALLGRRTEGGGQSAGIIPANATYKSPATQQVFHVGDTRKDSFGNTQAFFGKDPTGQPIWKYRPGDTIKGSGGKSYKVNPDGLTAEKM